VVVIQPEPNIVETSLIRIRMAHGYMRACDNLRAYQQHGAQFYLSNTARNSQLGKTAEITSLP
jgi:hypothetical protein